MTVDPPPRIEPGLQPGGVVFRLFDAAGELLNERRVGPDDLARAEVEEMAARDVARFGERAALLVGYDGDNGVLMMAVGGVGGGGGGSGR